MTPGARPGVDPDVPVGTTVGEYNITGKLGEGGMGKVYAAVHPVIGKAVAIKVLRADIAAQPLFRERFVLEAQAVNRVRHPNLVDIFAAGTLADGRPYLVMEQLEGVSLAARLASERMSPLRVIDILLALCEALAAVHRRGVVHRDLKPENVFLADVGGTEQLKLLDFGVAKFAAPGSSTLTAPGMVLGTPDYISPEQARGGDIGPSSDLYSLGVIAWEMFLEGLPFTGPTPMDTIANHLSAEPEAPSALWPDIPPELANLLLALLSKDPAARPDVDACASTLLRVRVEIDDRVRHFASSSSIQVVPQAARATVPAPRPLAAGRFRRRRLWWFALPGAAIVVAAVVAVFATGSEPSVPATAAPAPVPPAPAAEPVVAPAPPPALTSSVEVRVVGDGAQVWVGDRAVDLADGVARVDVDPGVHAVRVGAPGHRDYTRSLELAAGEARVIVVELEPVERTPRKPRKTRRAPADRFDKDGMIDPFAR